MLTCVGCQWRLKPDAPDKSSSAVLIERYDRIERLYLTMGDFAALQQMKTSYPTQTRTLIEDVLQLGPIDAPDINSRFFLFFQDTTLQALIADAERQFADVDDLNRELTHAFRRLQMLIPGIELPRVYAQIGSLDQSIIVGDGLLGISLDKYLGENHPIYIKYGYTDEQRRMMTRDFIVPDCVGFYLLSLYPMPAASADSVQLRREHMGRIQFVVNQVLGRQMFDSDYVARAARLHDSHHSLWADDLLRGRLQ